MGGSALRRTRGLSLGRMQGRLKSLIGLRSHRHHRCLHCLRHIGLCELGRSHERCLGVGIGRLDRSSDCHFDGVLALACSHSLCLRHGRSHCTCDGRVIDRLPVRVRVRCSHHCLGRLSGRRGRSAARVRLRSCERPSGLGPGLACVAELRRECFERRLGQMKLISHLGRHHTSVGSLLPRPRRFLGRAHRLTPRQRGIVPLLI